MGSILTFILLYCYISQNGNRKKEEAYCREKMREYGIKGDLEMKNYYFERLMRLK